MEIISKNILVRFAFNLTIYYYFIFYIYLLFYFLISHFTAPFYHYFNSLVLFSTLFYSKSLKLSSSLMPTCVKKSLCSKPSPHNCLHFYHKFSHHQIMMPCYPFPCNCLHLDNAHKLMCCNIFGSFAVVHR